MRGHLYALVEGIRDGIQALWDMMLCRLMSGCRRFEGSYESLQPLQTIQHRITQELNHQRHDWEKLKSRK